MSETTYTVSGMSCEHCSNAITGALTALPGVDSVDVEIATGKVTVTGASSGAHDVIRAAVDEAGYEVVDA
ncbi:cation transporter [Nocardia sp. NBC_01377]|uniref:heavy-metal-associated domain-containing protein n=1 Tax=Nocardia sp. NBC_01377 TaxID=2903595 RepID=UPI00324CB2F9